MIGAFFTHYLLNDKFERMAPVVVFTLLLICRLVIAYQVEKRERLAFEKFKQLSEEKEIEEEEESSIKEEANAVTNDSNKINSEKTKQKKSSKKNK